jgi:hypothetical protein
MGFWHTGYAEFHEPAGIGDYDYSPPLPVRFTCEHCSWSSLELEELRKHRFEQHPVRQPALLLRGRPLGASREVLMRPVAPSDVLVEDATSCLLNGKSLDLPHLGQQLAAMRHEYVEVELRNHGANIICRLDFQVADEAHLAGVETAFLQLARDRVLNIESVARFNDHCRAFASAMPYCNGISNYLYGVIARECSPESWLKHDEYIPRFLKSSEELSGFDRPLARSVRALVAFHFNQFDDAESLAHEGALRHAAGAFAGLLKCLPWHFNEGFSPAPGSVVEDLLTDQGTLQILADASHGLVVLKARAEALLTQLRRARPGGYDHTKRMLLTCEALAAREDLDMRVKARGLARELAGTTDTKDWAEAMLKRLLAT